MIFTNTEIELARQMALPREFREGDWYEWIEYPTSPRMSLPALATNGMYADADYIWLPLEGDCFAMLREAGWTLHGVDSDYEGYWAQACTTDGTDFKCYQKKGATPREALYRLLLAVK